MFLIMAHIRQGPFAKLVASRNVDSAVGAHGVLLALGDQSTVGALVHGAIRVLKTKKESFSSAQTLTDILIKLT